MLYKIVTDLLANTLQLENIKDHNCNFCILQDSVLLLYDRICFPSILGFIDKLAPSPTGSSVLNYFYIRLCFPWDCIDRSLKKKA